MPDNQSNFPIMRNESAETTLPDGISLKDLESIQGGSAAEEMEVLLRYKTKVAARAQLEISLMNSLITPAEHKELGLRIEHCPWWR